MRLFVALVSAAVMLTAAGEGNETRLIGKFCFEGSKGTPDWCPASPTTHLNKTEYCPVIFDVPFVNGVASWDFEYGAGPGSGKVNVSYYVKQLGGGNVDFSMSRTTRGGQNHTDVVVKDGECTYYPLPNYLGPAWNYVWSAAV